MRKLQSGQDMGTVSKNPVMRVIRWFKNYWYFYKAPMVIVGVLLFIIIGVLTSLLTKANTDFMVPVISQWSMEDADKAQLKGNIESFLPDINGDGKVRAGFSYILFNLDSQDELASAVYDAITSMLIYDQALFMIVDEYSADYLKGIGAIEPLSVLNISGGVDEYRLPLKGGKLLENTKIDQYIEYFLVVKLESQTSKEDIEYQARRAAVASLAEEILGQ